MIFKEEEKESDDDTEEVPSNVEEEAVPGMSLKPVTKTTTVRVVDPKDRKNINRAAVAELHRSKAFKAKERIKAKKQSTKARFAKGKRVQKKRERFHNPKKITKT